MNRVEIEFTLNDKEQYVVEWEGKQIVKPNPLALDKALDKAGAPRPRLLRRKKA